MISFEQKKMPVGNRSQAFIYTFGGKRGIRTPGASQLNGFQDRRNRPLCHLSERKNITEISFFQLRVSFFSLTKNHKSRFTGQGERGRLKK